MWYQVNWDKPTHVITIARARVDPIPAVAPSGLNARSSQGRAVEFFSFFLGLSRFVSRLPVCWRMASYDARFESRSLLKKATSLQCLYFFKGVRLVICCGCGVERWGRVVRNMREGEPKNDVKAQKPQPRDIICSNALVNELCNMGLLSDT